MTISAPDTGPTVDAQHIAAVRAFNRRYTRIIGVLRNGLVGTEFSLTEARILFELAHFGPAEVVDLRRTLDLDAGYLSRILAKFEDRALVERRRSDADARRQIVELTDTGRTVFAELDDRSQRDVNDLLTPHSPTARAHLVDAMHTIEKILDAPAANATAAPHIAAAQTTAAPGASHRPTASAAPDAPVAVASEAPALRIRDPRPGDHGWAIQRNAAIYAEEFGWNGEYEALAAEIISNFLNSHDPQRERAWIAEYRGAPVGCVYCMKDSETTARLRVLLVEPSARGLGVGSALVQECLRFATDAGYRDMVLWTNDVLTSARHIYERAGFTLVESNPHHSFGQDLVGQTWRKELVPDR
ncbi:bifunctional helix-turn-helix transcriptional regulator/GNAT family N-acetyltransferase [Nocardia sp. NPDC051030]|uniref:bifunctional helix-turn-helix transcriptional regulator/GNAT family N-acetyltransferase n=1 Tax=Nocardia sp. NPDC051030 TaxID=3155162 RepID=UPI0034161B96